MFIFIEEEDEEMPSMRIENKCTNISLVFQQVGNQFETEIDICDPEES